MEHLSKIAMVPMIMVMGTLLLGEFYDEKIYIETKILFSGGCFSCAVLQFIEYPAHLYYTESD